MIKKITRVLILSLMGTILLTGCKNSSEVIVCQGKENTINDNTTIKLKDGWFANGYTIDYENKQVIVSIEK